MTGRLLPANPVVAVVGASGAVGRVMLSILAERGFPYSQVRALATSRSAGQKIAFPDGDLTVVETGSESLDGVDLVLLDTPDAAAREIAPLAVNGGAIVVDNSAAWRMEDSVPLVVPEINPETVASHSGIIASPNCTTIGVVVPLFALHKRFDLERVVIASYQSVSGAGQAGVLELRDQMAKVADDLDSLALGEYRGPEPTEFPAPVAFNVIPQVGSIGEDQYTGEEWKLRFEARKIMGLPDLQATITCVRTPTVVGHGAAIHARFAQEVDPEAAAEVLRSAPGVEVVDIPTPLLSAGRDSCYVGRIRRDIDDPRALWFFSASDNLRKGAALNAVQVAELLLP